MLVLNQPVMCLSMLKVTTSFYFPFSIPLCLTYINDLASFFLCRMTNLVLKLLASSMKFPKVQVFHMPFLHLVKCWTKDQLEKSTNLLNFNKINLPTMSPLNKLTQLLLKVVTKLWKLITWKFQKQKSNNKQNQMTLPQKFQIMTKIGIMTKMKPCSMLMNKIRPKKVLPKPQWII